MAILVSEGDSLTASGWAQEYVTAANGSEPGRWTFTNVAVGGSHITSTNPAIETIEERDATVDALYEPGELCVLTVWIGANDLGGADNNSRLDVLEAYLAARKAVGWTVLVATLGPQDPSFAIPFTAAKAANDTRIRGWYGTVADAIIDVAADPILGTWSTDYYSDYVHHNSAGFDRMVEIGGQVIDTFISLTRRRFTLA